MSFPEPLAHGALQPLFEDVYWLQGSVRMGPGLTINRNMVVLRHPSASGDRPELTLINSVRLNAAGQKELAALGDVKHVIRIGNFHGMDDPYYVATFNAQFWSPAGHRTFAEPRQDHALDASTELPFPNATVFTFEHAAKPECALHVARGPGLLVTCDSVQHHVDMAGCSLLGRGAMRMMGFMRPMNIGPPWRKNMTKPGGSLQPDFERLLELDFAMAVGAHGSACRSDARDLLAATVASVYG